jgi:hypothetical protein
MIFFCYHICSTDFISELEVKHWQFVLGVVFAIQNFSLHSFHVQHMLGSSCVEFFPEIFRWLETRRRTGCYSMKESGTYVSNMCCSKCNFEQNHLVVQLISLLVFVWQIGSIPQVSITLHLCPSFDGDDTTVWIRHNQQIVHSKKSFYLEKLISANNEAWQQCFGARAAHILSQSILTKLWRASPLLSQLFLFLSNMVYVHQLPSATFSFGPHYLVDDSFFQHQLNTGLMEGQKIGRQNVWGFIYNLFVMMQLMLTYVQHKSKGLNLSFWGISLLLRFSGHIKSQTCITPVCRKTQGAPYRLALKPQGWVICFFYLGQMVN